MEKDEVQRESQSKETALKAKVDGDPSRGVRSGAKLLYSGPSPPEVRGEPLCSSQDEEQRLSSALVHHGSYLKIFEQQDSSRHSSRNQSREHLDHLIPEDDVGLNTYGIQELRDGFFDAVFHRPLPRDRQEMMSKALETLPLALQTHHPLSLKYFAPSQWSKLKDFVRDVTIKRSSIKLYKSLLGFLIAYIVCLVPASRHWLGPYNYVLPISALLNHPGRPIGSQVDGTILTIVGTAAGLGWGSLALYVSTSTSTAQRGYGGVLATFLVLFTVTVAWLRCTLMRLYQAVISAGIAVCYISLADTSEIVGWKKVFNYGIPWVLGQAICLVVSVAIMPDSGARSLTLAFQEALNTIRASLIFPRKDALIYRRNLSWHFVGLSTAVRDFTIEISISRLDPEDIRLVRNLVQSVIRALLPIKTDTRLFDILRYGKTHETSGTVTSQEEITERNPLEESRPPILQLIARHLAGPTESLISTIVTCIEDCNAIITDLGSQRSSNLSHNPHGLSESLRLLSASIDFFDEADAALIADPMFPSKASTLPEVVSLFLFVHPLRQAADNVKALSEKILQMQQCGRGWKIQLPSYPLHKQLNRTNAQVRHDRGGLTAGFYFRTKTQLDRTMADLQSRPFIPTSRHDASGAAGAKAPIADDAGHQKTTASGPNLAQPEPETFRFKMWIILHRMQGFESRFAFKVVLVTTLLSVPAWLEQSRGWWNTYESWWTVVTVWLMTHPRVSGTFQDLAARLICVALGAVWGGLAYTARSGNPYVMAVFAVVFMIPMMYRYTQSAHPRSGVIGCISFTVVSLSTLTNGGRPSTVTIAWTRGLAFAVAILASILTNWIMWPFIARHELRKSLSAMMLHLAILYRGVVSKYIYYDKGHEPRSQDIERSEMLEGRLREGFVRIRQLMELTRHEIRLRAPFDPLPYSALIEACERFFEHLVEVRQSSLYFQPSLRITSPEANKGLISYRRDAVAVILMNLYILAAALRARQPVPLYMPSAAAARKKLIDKMEEVEAKQATQNPVLDGKEGRRWADVYRFAFSSALTDIVEQLQQLQKYTREITGEAGFATVDVE
ncbi:MAG: hypothetical protein Q9225_003318 [Loekoesia sp. 1 TL-2023]